MCGISGFIDYSKSLSSSSVNDMVKVLSHRGPDYLGAEFHENNDFSIAFGHSRLSIIDLSSNANQPFFYDSKKYWLVFNGEVYNFLEIKEELIALGFKFKTNSDTEVVLFSYLAWGNSCVKKFIGMFSFAIYDKTKEKIILYRDRAGVKPLFYYMKDNLFMFSSEIKSFHKIKSFNKDIDIDSVALFFRHGYIDSPFSIYKNVKKLMPGHYMEFCLKNKSIDFNKYWDPIDYYNKPKLDISFSEAKRTLNNMLSSAFNYRMVSDVPVGVFLSGGYDSSTTAAILSSTNSSKINTFTIGFEGSSFDESENAEKIAKHLNTNHETLQFKKDHLHEIIGNIPFYYDEPFGDSSALPSILVSKMASNNVRVVLSSDAGDELFAGYPKHYQHLSLYKIIAKTPNLIKNRFAFLENFKRFEHRKGLFSSKNISELLKVRLETVVFNENEVSKILNQNFTQKSTSFDKFKLLNNHNDFINKLLCIDYKTYLENDILVKVDRATMSQSIEGREPYLDHRLLEFSSRLPSNFKYNRGVSKYILKEINKDYIPDSIMDKNKKGFGGPVDLWLKKFLKNELLSLIKSEDFPEHLLNRIYIENFVSKFNNGSHNEWYKVYQIFTFLSWHKYWN